MAKIGINIAMGSLQQKEMIVGIDLGTTNSLVAIIHPDTKNPVVLKEHDGAVFCLIAVHDSAVRLFGRISLCSDKPRKKNFSLSSSLLAAYKIDWQKSLISGVKKSPAKAGLYLFGNIFLIASGTFCHSLY